MRRAVIDTTGRLALGDQARLAGYAPGTVVDVLLTKAVQLIITPTDFADIIDLKAKPPPADMARRAITPRVVP